MGNTHDTEMARIEADHIQTKWLTSQDYRWGYSTERGPDTWWMHYPSASGGMQSPVNIVTEETYIDSDLASNLLRICYRSPPGVAGSRRQSTDGGTIGETLLLTNTGNTFQLNVVNSQSYITGGPCRDYSYVLDQVQIHWGPTDSAGSEHLINSRPYAAEMQLVHWNEDLYLSYEDAAKSNDGLIILSVFVKLTEDRCSEALEEIGRLVEDIPYRNQNVPAKDVQVMSLLPDDIHKYWTYEGSLTMPPCYETVNWVIFEKPILVTKRILEKFRRMRSYCDNEVRPMNDDFDGYVISNRRPVQPIGTRKVSYIDSTHLVVHYDHVRKRLQPFRGRRKDTSARTEALQGAKQRCRDGSDRGRCQRGCNRG